MNVARCESSISTSRRQTRASEPRATTMSLSAKWRVSSRVGAGRPGCVVREAGPAQDPALERHPFVDPVLALGDQPEHGLEVVALGLRQEADLAEVDPEQRDVHFRDRARRPKERAVAPEDDEHVRRRELAKEGRRVARRRFPLPDSADLAPAGGAGTELDRGLDRGVVGKPDPLDGH